MPLKKNQYQCNRAFMIIIKDPNSVNYIKMNKAYFNDKEVRIHIVHFFYQMNNAFKLNIKDVIKVNGRLLCFHSIT